MCSWVNVYIRTPLCHIQSGLITLSINNNGTFTILIFTFEQLLLSGLFSVVTFIYGRLFRDYRKIFKNVVSLKVWLFKM